MYSAQQFRILRQSKVPVRDVKITLALCDNCHVTLAVTLAHCCIFST
jgi:hypothetical protein